MKEVLQRRRQMQESCRVVKQRSRWSCSEEQHAAECRRQQQELQVRSSGSKKLRWRQQSKSRAGGAAGEGSREQKSCRWKQRSRRGAAVEGSRAGELW